VSLRQAGQLSRALVDVSDPLARVNEEATGNSPSPTAT